MLLKKQSSLFLIYNFARFRIKHMFLKKSEEFGFYRCYIHIFISGSVVLFRSSGLTNLHNFFVLLFGDFSIWQLARQKNPPSCDIPIGLFILPFLSMQRKDADPGLVPLRLSPLARLFCCVVSRVISTRARCPVIEFLSGALWVCCVQSPVCQGSFIIIMGLSFRFNQFVSPCKSLK